MSALMAIMVVQLFFKARSISFQAKTEFEMKAYFCNKKVHAKLNK